MTDAAQPEIDTVCIEKLKTLFGAKYSQLVGNFLSNVTGYLDDMARLLAAGDRAAVAALAHKMKSSSGQFGLREVQKLSAEIEHSGASSDAELQARYVQLRLAYDTAVNRLQQLGLAA